MWNVDPSKLCRNHLLGEHVEMHMFVGAILKNKSLNGYINGGLVEVHNIQNRHDKLVVEILRRGYNHKSPLPKFHSYIAGKIDINKNIEDLRSRCKECKPHKL